MADSPKLEPGDLTEEELLDVVEQIRGILWPRGGQRSPSALEQMEMVLTRYHLEP